MILAAKSSSSFVDLNVPVSAWVLLFSVVAVLIAFDLWRHRDDHEPTPKESAVESAGYVIVGLLFGVYVLTSFGTAAFGEYMSGYVIEKSLSVDNVFVWSVIFSSFAIPLKYQHRVLFWGIFGALVLRAVFVFAGSALIEAFWWMLLVFGAVLIVSGVKVMRHKEDEGDSSHSRSVALLGRFLPVSETLDGHRFFTRVNGIRSATPLLAALVVVEATDIVFAVDSVPAILAVSREPFIVIASNAFAILGLRALYFLLANAKSKFHYLSHALGAILVFVGLKMLAAHWYHLPTPVSLGVICTMLVLAVLASAAKQRRLEGLPPKA